MNQVKIAEGPATEIPDWEDGRAVRNVCLRILNDYRVAEDDWWTRIDVYIGAPIEGGARIGSDPNAKQFNATIHSSEAGKGMVMEYNDAESVFSVNSA